MSHIANISIGVSIIVPTRNRRAELAQCLRSLTRLAYEPFEVIVVDDASSYAVAALVAGLFDRRVRVIRSETRLGKSRARNLGVRQAAHGLVAFIDDDCTADRLWLSRLGEPFTDPNVGFVIGETQYVRDDHRGRFPERVVQNLWAQWPSAGNLAYRKSTFEALGGFNEDFDRFNNEDTELGMRAVARGVAYARQPDARVYHQATQWTARSLLASAKNVAVFVPLVVRYPRTVNAFGRRVWFGRFVQPLDYLLIAVSPVLVPLLAIRFWRHGQRNWLVFFAKWPAWFVLRRIFVWIEAVRQRRFML